MSLTLEDILLIAETVEESYKLHRLRVGPELAGEITEELREQLTRQYLEDKEPK